MVPSSDAHCLTQPPPAIPPGLVIVVRAREKGTMPTSAQIDQLTDSLADQGEYSQRAWRLCGAGAK